MKDLYLEDVSEILMRVELSSHNVSPSRAQNTPKRLSTTALVITLGEKYVSGETKNARTNEDVNTLL